MISKHTKARWRIALIEDSKLFQDVHRQILKPHHLDIFDSGQAGLSAIASGQQYDCLLLDLHLPDMSGTEMLHRIREINSNLPIIYIASQNDEKVVLSALSGGGEDCIFKDEISSSTLIRSILFAIERARAREENHKRQNDLERERCMNARQKEFISMVSHEFRTPIAVISSSAQLAQQKICTYDDQALSKHLNKTLKSVRRLTSLIDNALCFSRLEEGKSGFSPTFFNLRHTITEAIDYFRELYPLCRFTYNEDHFPELFFGDPPLCEQIMNNLISNAAKYSSGSQEPIEISLKASNEAIQITVVDHGRGIASADLPHLGERFFRGANTIGTMGSGIGLHLTQRFVNMHDGILSFESKEGEGTCVTVTLPIKHQESSRLSA